MKCKEGTFNRIKTAWIAHKYIEGSRRRAGRWGLRIRGSRTSLDAQILNAVSEKGLSLPPPKRAAQIRQSLVSRAAAIQGKNHVADDRSLARHRLAPLRKGIPAIAKVAIAAVVALVLLFTVGLSSSYAMPGNPLYSVKRLIEKAHLFFLSGGESKADTYLSHAARRLDEIKYVKERRMGDWYFPLARDAENCILASQKEASSLSEEAAVKILTQTATLLARLESMVREIRQELPIDQWEILERGLDEAKEALVRYRPGFSQKTDVSADEEGTEAREGTPESPTSQPEPPQPQPDNTPGPPEGIPPTPNPYHGQPDRLKR